MNRKGVLVVGTVAALVWAFGSGAPVAPGVAKPAAEKQEDAAKATVAVGHKTAVFNMAAVMRDFNQAKYRVWLLNKRRETISKDVVAWRTEYIEIQTELRTNTEQPKKDELTRRMLELARKIEDDDRTINKVLNDEASQIIGELHDMMKAVVDRTAEQNGFQLVIAYPDAVTPEERNSPYIKELKLKPPAGQPFYIAPEIDITARVIRELNAKYPAIDPETKKPVDVSKLDTNSPPPVPNKTPLPLPPIPPAPPKYVAPAPVPDKKPLQLPPIPSVP